jgi:SAM-dependent methyltransferase
VTTAAHTPNDLGRIYSQRFDACVTYRNEVWKILTRDFFQKWVLSEAAVLDLGCGYGEFINHIRCAKKYGMDLNAMAERHLGPEVKFISQDCSQPWPLSDASLDVIFTSNFFEHLPSKATLSATFEQAFRCLRPDGRLIAMGPNIKFLPGRYWDFWDHYLPLTELSLAERLTTHGFQMILQRDRFLPYTMVGGRRWPMAFVRAYLKFPLAWKVLGKQFLIVAEKRPARNLGA